MTDELDSTPPAAWPQALETLNRTVADWRFLVSAAVRTNQTQLATDLLAAAAEASKGPRTVIYLGKPFSGMKALAADALKRFEEEPWPRDAGIAPPVVDFAETNDYAVWLRDSRTVWANARAVVAGVDELAPMFDETLEAFGAQSPDACAKLIFAVTSAAGGAPNAEAVETARRKARSKGVLVNTPVCGDSAWPDCARLLAETLIPEVNAVLVKSISTHGPKLDIAIRLFHYGLDMEEQQWKRRWDYANRDLTAAEELHKKFTALLAKKKGEIQAGYRAALGSVAAEMCQEAEGVVRRRGVSKETLGSSENRESFGRDATKAGRTRGYEVLRQKADSAGLEMTAACTLLMAELEQIRTSAVTHLDEFIGNLGFERDKSEMDNGLSGALAAIGAAIEAERASIFQGTPDPDFATSFDERWETFFVTGMTNHVKNGWVSSAIDAKLVSAADDAFAKHASGPAGTVMKSLGDTLGNWRPWLKITRPESLADAGPPSLRANLAATYGGYLARLRQILKKA